MDEIDYLISLLNSKKSAEISNHTNQKLCQVNYYVEEEDYKSIGTNNNLILPVLRTTINSKTESMKNIIKKNNIKKINNNKIKLEIKAKRKYITNNLEKNRIRKYLFLVL